MRWLILLLCLLILSSTGYGQTPRKGNDKPEIIGQKTLMMQEDESLEIELSDLYVIDWDDFYPFGFSMTLFPGDNYSFSGHTITPAHNFHGTLKVPVTVNDGTDDSKKYNLKVDVQSVNDSPIITAQRALSTNQDQPITISLNDLTVNDADDDYPDGFSFALYDGANYRVSGHTVTPAQGFTGMLSVPVTVNDGSKNSAVFNLQIQVIRTNAKPVITGQSPLATTENQSITIKLSDLAVSDPDNTYPDDFSLKVLSGINCQVSGNTVIPNHDFVGTLSARVTVNDGTTDSAPFGITVVVKPVNRVPQIIGQVSLRINEDEALTILLSHLKVTDADDHYPDGFTLNILEGKNYTIGADNEITPASDFNGNLPVVVTVNDGTNTSDPYNLMITVNPVNDAPVITNIESNALNYALGKGAVAVTDTFQAEDIDDDSLSVAEIKFDIASYNSSQDTLLFANTANIRGVFDRDAGILSMIGKAPIAEYVEAIRSIRYSYVNDNPATDSKMLFFTLNDGKNLSLPAQRLINLAQSFVDLDVPSGFTPNGDQVNDTWSVRPSKNTDSRARPSIRVYSKGGVLVYETEGFNHEWDGRFNGEFLPPDTYYYTIDLNLPSAKSRYNGLVTILR